MGTLREKRFAIGRRILAAPQGDRRQGRRTRGWTTPRRTVATVMSAGALVATVAVSGSAAAAGSPATTSTTAAGSTTTTTPAQGQISAGEAQVASIEAQIAQEQATLDAASEAYDRAIVELDATKSALASTTASLDVQRAKLHAARSVLRSNVVASYIDGTASQAVSHLFAAPSGSAQTRTLYQQLGIGNLALEVARVQSGQRELSATQAKLQAEEEKQTAQADAANQAAQQANAAATQSQATLAQVKGTLAQEIAQQAATQAAAAAAAAAAATTTSGRQSAAAQASQDAQVASTVSGGSAAATSANTSANQAATAGGSGGSGTSGTGGSVGTGGTGGSGTSGTGGTGGTIPVVAPDGSSNAAGLAAVHGAMAYLGVPYVWGGASSAGVDCSGLTMLAWAAAGVSLPHSAALQYADFPHVNLDALEPGDLLFYNLDGTGIDHVVMYVGPTLDGQATAYGSLTIIQAAHTGTVVTFDPLWYYGLVGAARP
ncbi:MAG: C40 family peptidase [Acidimicrobiales bacterium]